jgi:hypothetical protein
MSVRTEASLEPLQPVADALFAEHPDLAALCVSWEAERRGDRWTRGWGIWPSGGRNGWTDPEPPPPHLSHLALVERFGARLLPGEQAPRGVRHVLLLAPGLAMACEEDGLDGLRLRRLRLWSAEARPGVPLLLPRAVALPLLRATAAGVRFLPGEGSAHARLEAACRLPAARARGWLSARAGGAGVALAVGGPWVVACAARSRAVIGITLGLF